MTPTDWKLNPSSALAPATWKLQNYDCGHGNVKVAFRFFFQGVQCGSHELNFPKNKQNKLHFQYDAG